MELGILTLHGRAAHPQTQGKEESFNRSMTKELLKHATITDFSDAQRQFDTYRAFYNNERPHHSLNLEVPSKKYTRSPRLYSEKISQWEYPPECQIRRVKETGHFNWEGQGYFLSEAFGGKEIAVRESRVEGCISLFFRQFRIARIDVEKRVYVFRRAYLIEGDPRLKDKLKNENCPRLASPGCGGSLIFLISCLAALRPLIKNISHRGTMVVNHVAIDIGVRPYGEILARCKN